MKRTIIILLALLVLSLCVFSQQVTEDEKARLLQEKKNEDAFLGWGFGMGLGAIFRSPAKVLKASIVDGIVRVEESEAITPTFLFETHFLIDIRKNEAKNRMKINDVSVNANPSKVATGPFACVLSTNDQFLDSVGLGWMISFRKADSSKCFNIGIGGIVERAAQYFRDDFVENESAPTAATEVAFKKIAKLGFVIVLSFSI